MDRGKLRTGAPNNLQATREAQCGKYSCNNDVGPNSPGPKNADGRNHDCNVSNRVIARTDPHGPHICIAPSEAEKHQSDADIHRKGERAAKALADQGDFAGLEKLIDANTKAVFCESIGNPAGNVVDIQRLAEIAQRVGRYRPRCCGASLLGSLEAA